MGFCVGNFEMRVAVRGFSPVVDLLEWKTAATWYAEALLGRPMAGKIGLNIELAAYLRGIIGSVACSDWRRPRNFLIQIETGKFKRRKQLSTLAHEMIHIKQIVSGDLTVRNGELRWKAKVEPGDFADEPWEREAWGREQELYKAYEASRGG